MNKFEYTLMSQELYELATTKAKKDFIKKAKKLGGHYYNGLSYYAIKLLIETYNTIPTSVVGVKSLPATISTAIGYSKLTLTEMEDLSALLPQLKITATNAYREFMYASGIPAYLKLAVLEASHNDNKRSLNGEK